MAVEPCSSGSCELVNTFTELCNSIGKGGEKYQLNLPLVYHLVDFGGRYFRQVGRDDDLLGPPTGGQPNVGSPSFMRPTLLGNSAG